MSEGASACSWRFELGAGGDLYLALDEQSPLGARSGELVIVAGVALLSRGVTMPEGSEIDALDGPGLMLQLVLELLGRTIAGGPAVVSTRAVIDHNEHDEPLTLQTLSASASFPAPWRSQGEVRRTGEATFAFDLVFTYGKGTGEESSLRLSGTWSQVSPAPALDDQMSLDGWLAFSLGPRVSDSTLEYGARPVTEQVTTLGQLRKLLAEAHVSS